MSRVYDYSQNLATQEYDERDLVELCKKCMQLHYPLHPCKKDRRKITSKEFDSVIEKIIKESENEQQ